MSGILAIWKNQNIYEFWEYTGEIMYKNHENTIEKKSKESKKLKGIILIKENCGKKEIQIEISIGEINNKKLNIYGIESNAKNNKGFSYKIKEESKKNLDFPSEILMIKINDDISKIVGDIKNSKAGIKLELNLKKNIVYEISNSLCGMNNLINTCFINSSFQILIHIPQFVEIIRNKQNDINSKNNIISNINFVFDKIIKAKKENNPVIDPSIFVNNFKNEHERYNNYFPNDTELFLEDLIWDINSELIKQKEKIVISHIKSNNKKVDLFNKFLEESKLNYSSKISDLFYVLFCHEKICKSCEFSTYFFDESTGLKLNFKQGNNQKHVNLNSLIMDNFKEPKLINSAFICKNCKKSNVIYEKTRIAKLPQILILSLQKTNINCTIKIPYIVKYETEFSLEEIIDKDLCNLGNYNYKLYAINNHIGSSPESGHYYSTIYLENLQSWFSFNDNIVSPIEEPDANINNYILFYEQKNKTI